MSPRKEALEEHFLELLDQLRPKTEYLEAVLEFAQYVVLNSRRLWEEFPLDLRRRMQKVLFPEGLVYDGEAFRTPVTCLFFRDSAGAEAGRYKGSEFELKKMVALRLPLSNPLIVELTAFESLRTAVG